MGIGALSGMLIDAVFQIMSKKLFNLEQMIGAGIAGTAGGGFVGVTRLVKADTLLSTLNKVGTVITAGSAASGVSVGVATVNSVRNGKGGISGSAVVAEVISTVAPTPGKVTGNTMGDILGAPGENNVGETLVNEIVEGTAAKAVDDTIKDEILDSEGSV